MVNPDKPPVPPQTSSSLSDRSRNSIDDFDERMWAERDKPRKDPVENGGMTKDQKDEFFRDIFRPED